jgi:carbon starvation protein CstA
MFITVACGAVSGFHSTQAPIMARCVETERESRFIFYGAMIAEGIIALIWAAAGVAFYDSTGGLLNALNSLGQSGVVYDISVGVMGAVGGILAVLGVVICPITSGDTAFRSARLIISDWFHIDQSTIKRRLMITIPLLLVGGILTQMDFTILWRYFSWSNQFLAAIVLWTAAVYLTVHARRKIYSFACAIPATFMSAVTCAYILQAKEGLSLSATFSNTAGIIFAVVCLAVFLGTSMRGTTKQRLLGAASDDDTEDEPLKVPAASPDSSVD